MRNHRWFRWRIVVLRLERPRFSFIASGSWASLGNGAGLLPTGNVRAARYSAASRPSAA
jgi:hypothetical protein